MRDLQFHTNDFSIIWRINYNATVTGSNIHCDLIKQPREQSVQVSVIAL